jgi:hypothetical protein
MVDRGATCARRAGEARGRCREGLCRIIFLGSSLVRLVLLFLAKVPRWESLSAWRTALLLDTRFMLGVRRRAVEANGRTAACERKIANTFIHDIRDNTASVGISNDS